MRQLGCLLLASMTLLLTGCASLSKDECVTADWRLIGYEDGAGGEHPTVIGKHRKACAKHGVVPDKDAYDAGYREGNDSWCSFSRGQRAGADGQRYSDLCSRESEYALGHEAGLHRYCTYDRGYSEGLDGRAYQNQCPRSLEDAFVTGNNFGLHVHGLTTRLETANNRLETIADELEELVNQAETIKGKIAYDTALSGDARAALLNDLQANAEERKALAVEQDQLQHQAHALRDELDDLGLD